MTAQPAPRARSRLAAASRWAGALGLALAVAGCATAEPPRPARAATDGDKLTVGRALLPLLFVSGLWRGPADGCAAALGIQPSESINLAVAPHPTCRFGLVVTEGALRALTHRELQAALAHEIGHVRLGHFAARQARREAEQRTDQTIGAAGGAGTAAVSVIPVVGPLIALGVIAGQVVAALAAKGVYRGYDRDEEAGADRFAIRLLDQVEPGRCSALVALFERMEGARDGALWAPWVDTHPTLGSRLGDAQAACPGP